MSIWKKRQEPALAQKPTPWTPSVSNVNQSIMQSNPVTVMMYPPGGGPGMGTNYYLHDPNFAESVHIGKTAVLTAAKLSWFTDTAFANGQWTDTDTLIGYLRNLEVDSFVMSVDGTPRYIAWVADEYGDVCMPGQMADDIMRCYDHQTTSGTFS